MGTKRATVFVIWRGWRVLVCTHRAFLEFLKLQNAIYALCVVLHPHAFVCAGPQNSSVRIIMGTAVKSAGWQKVETSQELSTAGLLWEMCYLVIDVSCFLWREHQLKNTKHFKIKKEKSLEFWRSRTKMKLPEHVSLIFPPPLRAFNLSAINYWPYLHSTNKDMRETVKISMGSKRPLCSINYASGACLITWNTRLVNKTWPDLLIIKMQNNLLPVCCSYRTWRGAVSQPRCLLLIHLHISADLVSL